MLPWFGHHVALSHPTDPRVLEPYPETKTYAIQSIFTETLVGVLRQATVPLLPSQWSINCTHLLRDAGTGEGPTSIQCQQVFYVFIVPCTYNRMELLMSPLTGNHAHDIGKQKPMQVRS